LGNLLAQQEIWLQNQIKIRLLERAKDEKFGPVAMKIESYAENG